MKRNKKIAEKSNYSVKKLERSFGRDNNSPIYGTPLRYQNPCMHSISEWDVDVNRIDGDNSIHDPGIKRQSKGSRRVLRFLPLFN